MSESSLTKMTSRERVVAALAGKPVDRTPACTPTSVATVELMDLANAPFPDANRRPQLMADLAMTAYTELGFDTVMPVFSIIQESSAIGCKMQWEKKDNWPTVRMSEPVWFQPEDIRYSRDMLEHPDAKCVPDAIRIIRKELGNEVAIIGKSMGPWSMSYHGFGVEPFLLMSLDDESKTKRCLDKLKEMTVDYAIMQFEAGADAITLPDHATGDLVSGEYYDRYLRDLHAELAERIPGPIILHICGRTVDRMGSIGTTGMAAFHFDSKNTPEEAKEAVTSKGGDIVLVGNINNPETLFSKGPEEVRQEVYRNLDAGIQMVGPECAIPLQTAIENLKEIPRAVRSWHETQAA